ncbi:MAG: hypothetical protein KatS3mg052_1762 [Candidatus Roseilinea sp.]|nr:MAG: hypothetical protein KatS3mg052_1762 [Candidatus Roseilinea sp.]
MPNDIQFYDDPDGRPFDRLPKRPPSDARITDYRVMPWPDGTRVTVEMGLTPFKEFPSIDVSILTEDGEVLRCTSLVGAMERRPAPTMWLPRGIPKGTSLVALIEVLGDEAPLQTVRVAFTVAGPIIKQAIAL